MSSKPTPPTGILLIGPQGSGKTTVAENIDKISQMLALPDSNGIVESVEEDSILQPEKPPQSKGAQTRLIKIRGKDTFVREINIDDFIDRTPAYLQEHYPQADLPHHNPAAYLAKRNPYEGIHAIVVVMDARVIVDTNQTELRAQRQALIDFFRATRARAGYYPPEFPKHYIYLLATHLDQLNDQQKAQLLTRWRTAGRESTLVDLQYDLMVAAGLFDIKVMQPTDKKASNLSSNLNLLFNDLSYAHGSNSFALILLLFIFPGVFLPAVLTSVIASIIFKTGFTMLGLSSDIASLVIAGVPIFIIYFGIMVFSYYSWKQALSRPYPYKLQGETDQQLQQLKNQEVHPLAGKDVSLATVTYPFDSKATPAVETASTLTPVAS